MDFVQYLTSIIAIVLQFFSLAKDIQPPLRTNGNLIVDTKGIPVHLHCVSWSGAHMQDYLTFGLEYQSVEYLVSMIKKARFNCVRFEFSAEMVLKNPVVDPSLLKPNRQLMGKTAIEIYQYIIQELTSQKIMVILDYHMMDAKWCCDPFDDNGLWFNSRWSEAQVQAQLETMVRLNANNPWVIGVDIRNEIRPNIHLTTVFGQTVLDPVHTHYPTWNTGLESDWKAAAERFGNLVLANDPNMLVIVQGIFVFQWRDLVDLLGGQTDFSHLHFPQSLRGVANAPIKLNIPNRVVYSAHDYSWHYDVRDWSQVSYDTFKGWVNRDWGYVMAHYPVFMGEFGTSHDETGMNSVWFHYISRYIKETKVHWSWWEFAGIEFRETGEENTFGVMNPTFTDFAYYPMIQFLQELMF